MASSMKSVDFTATANGSLLLSTGSVSGGMRGMLASALVTGNVPHQPLHSARTYYIAADEVLWDFLPSGINLCDHNNNGAASSFAHPDTLHALPERTAGGVMGDAPHVGYNGQAGNGIEPDFSLYTNRHASPHRIGTKCACTRTANEPSRLPGLLLWWHCRYVMALFREYEDSSFTRLRHGFRSRANVASAHLGMQGPVLRALPGEAFVVVVHNRLRFACNFHIDGLRPQGGAADERPLLPGETRTITFVVDETSSPLSLTSVAFSYSSDYASALNGLAAHAAATNTPPPAVDNFADTNAGLFGAVIVTSSREVAQENDMAPTDVNREFVLFMGVLDQNKSPYLRMNIQQFAAAPECTPTHCQQVDTMSFSCVMHFAVGTDVDTSHPDFKESNRMHAINGRVYCNLEGLEIMFGRTGELQCTLKATRHAVCMLQPCVCHLFFLRQLLCVLPMMAALCSYAHAISSA